jgi:hypothetical protein
MVVKKMVKFRFRQEEGYLQQEYLEVLTQVVDGLAQVLVLIIQSQGVSLRTKVLTSPAKLSWG